MAAKIQKGFTHICCNCQSDRVTVGNYSRYWGREEGIFFQCDKCGNREEW